MRRAAAAWRFPSRRPPDRSRARRGRLPRPRLAAGSSRRTPRGRPRRRGRACPSGRCGSPPPRAVGAARPTAAPSVVMPRAGLGVAAAASLACPSDQAGTAADVPAEAFELGQGGSGGVDVAVAGGELKLEEPDGADVLGLRTLGWPGAGSLAARRHYQDAPGA